MTIYYFAPKKGIFNTFLWSQVIFLSLFSFSFFSFFFPLMMLWCLSSLVVWLMVGAVCILVCRGRILYWPVGFHSYLCLHTSDFSASFVSGVPKHAPRSHIPIWGSYKAFGCVTGLGCSVPEISSSIVASELSVQPGLCQMNVGSLRDWICGLTF